MHYHQNQMCVVFSPALAESSDLLLDPSELGLHSGRSVEALIFGEILGRQEEKHTCLGAEVLL